MADRPALSDLLRGLPEGATARALVEAALEWSSCLVPGDLWLHDDFDLALWHRLRDGEAELVMGANVIRLSNFTRKT